MDNTSPIQPQRFRKLGYFIAVAVNIFLFYLFNNIHPENIYFLTEDFNQLLSVLNLSIAANILANMFFIVHDNDRFISLIKILLNILGVFVMYTALRVFPFDFSAAASWGNTLAKVLLGLGMFGSGVAVVVESVKFFSTRHDHGDEDI